MSYPEAHAAKSPCPKHGPHNTRVCPVPAAATGGTLPKDRESAITINGTLALQEPSAVRLQRSNGMGAQGRAVACSASTKSCRASSNRANTCPKVTERLHPVKETTSEGETSEDRLKRHKEKSSA